MCNGNEARISCRNLSVAFNAWVEWVYQYRNLVANQLCTFERRIQRARHKRLPNPMPNSKLECSQVDARSKAFTTQGIVNPGRKYDRPCTAYHHHMLSYAPALRTTIICCHTPRHCVTRSYAVIRPGTAYHDHMLSYAATLRNTHPHYNPYPSHRMTSHAIICCHTPSIANKCP